MNTQILQYTPIIITVISTLIVILLYTRTKLWIFSILFITLIAFACPDTCTLSISALIILFNIRFIRKYILALPILKALKALQFLPTISNTEK